MHQALVHLLHSENSEVHRAALCALRAYAVEGQFAVEVEARGALGPTIKHLPSTTPDVRARALALLR